MGKEQHFRKLENMMKSAPFSQLTGVTTKVSEGRTEVVMPIEEKLFHAAGALHGALYFMVLDNAAVYAANSMVEDVGLVTMSFTIYLTRPVSKGRLRAVGKLVNSTRDHFIAESVLYDSEGREIARGNGIFVRSKAPLTEEIGYK
jgi:uncharacterized protein (TIGR00369 family)